jgi:periplasmic divalent cation tolerance protein
MNPQAIVVLCACPDASVAERLARALVEERLAACVNRLDGVHSTYVWEDAVHDEPEVLLLIKTSAARLESVELRIKALHPYELPEIIALPIVGGSTAYLEWVTRGSGVEPSRLGGPPQVE